MDKLPAGLYDLLHTAQLHKRLEEFGLLEQAEWSSFEAEELQQYLVIPLAHEIAKFISDSLTGRKGDTLAQKLEDIFQSPEILSSVLAELKPISAQTLQSIKPEVSIGLTNTIRPDTPLSVSALLTGSSRSPALRTQIIKELASCDRADWLVSFIKYAGILPLLPTLHTFTQNPAPDGGPRLRIATTSYMGATDIKAIEELLKLPNTEVRISYDTKRTRLHAKAYLFCRDTGFSSAYIGSANVSKAALDEGLEWTAKISQYETNHLWQYAKATFESHWEDESEFTPCHKKDLSKLKKALSQESGDSSPNDNTNFFDLRPYTFQQVILDDILAERSIGKHKHLVIAATGTGKTMIAAFDYKNFCHANGGRPRLLFIAHREEILRQARAAFRQVLRDGSFGELVVSGKVPEQNDHLFCTVQSWNSRHFDQYKSNYFHYIVLDEAHHAAAKSYQRLIDHIRPKSLLGLTATPERNDGGDIRVDFGGAFTHEIRLSEAIERSLLSPFHYFGIPDLDGLDFSTIAWKRGGYDLKLLSEQLEGNTSRAQWVMSQTDRYVANMDKVRGLGFCVSVAHAKFMEDFCNSKNIPAVSLSGDSPKDLRFQVQRQLENYKIRFIFTVDLYNEGVDLPYVDTVLFLRPTESLTVFLQQLGRGLRLHEEKSHLTVLDFIAPQNNRFSFAKRFQSLTSRPELRIDKQIESDMPFVPAGCLLHLEKQAKEHILNNIKAATANLRGEKLFNELRNLRSQNVGEINLQQIMDFLHIDLPDEIYKRGLPHVLLSKAENKTLDDDLIKFDNLIAKGFRRLILMDDTFFIEDAKKLISTGVHKLPLTNELLHSVLWGDNKPDQGTLDDVQQFFISRKGLERDLTELLEWLLRNRSPIQEKRFENYTGPLNLHASYTREQIILALGLGSFEKPKSSREGVLHVPERNIDVFFADINKSEADFSPTTMYEDYAITDRLFHWQSQSQTSETSPVGKRYIQHSNMGYVPLLFIRERKKLSNGLTAPYFFAGPLKYRQHEGSKPISFIWELEFALSAKVMSWAKQI